MKICHRVYTENSLLKKVLIHGVECCPNCEKPVACHNAPIEKRALFWSLSGDTGISSEAICAHMTGNPTNKTWGFQAPSDMSDRGRCIRLLELIPEWIERLPEMVQYDAGNVIINGAKPIPRSEDSHSWTQQIPLIMQEGRL